MELVAWFIVLNRSGENRFFCSCVSILFFSPNSIIFSSLYFDSAMERINNAPFVPMTRPRLTPSYV